MLDRHALGLLKPALDACAQRLHRCGVRADAVTLVGFVLGLAGSGVIAAGGPLWLAAALGTVSRLLDGLDGAVARLAGPTARGAFLDIALDFLFYASVPLAFALRDPATNALAAAVLLACFIGTGSSFLAYAVLVERLGGPQRLAVRPTQLHKGFVFLGGLTEGTETLMCFAAMCLWPQHFVPLAWGFAALCVLTTATRLWAGWRDLASPTQT